MALNIPQAAMLGQGHELVTVQQFNMAAIDLDGVLRAHSGENS